MSLTKFGDTTKSVFLKAIEAHKLHQEFEVATGAATIKGQPVKLNAAGEVLAAAAAEKNYIVIGYALHTRSAGELVTVAMKAIGIVWAKAMGALNAGPVKIGVVGAETATLQVTAAATGAGDASVDIDGNTITLPVTVTTIAANTAEITAVLNALAGYSATDDAVDTVTIVKDTEGEDVDIANFSAGTATTIAATVAVTVQGTDPFYRTYEATSDTTDAVGFALDAASGADELIRVAIL